MSNNRTLKRIGGKLREDSRDIVEVELPEVVRVLLRQLACMDGAHKIAQNGSSPEAR